MTGNLSSVVSDQQSLADDCSRSCGILERVQPTVDSGDYSPGRKCCGVMARVPPLTKQADDRQRRVHRLVVVERHLREELRLAPGEAYTNDWEVGLQEIICHMVTHRAVSQKPHIIQRLGETINRRLIKDGLSCLSQRQIQRFFSGITSAQRQAVKLTLVESGLELEELTATERWYQQIMGRDALMARDATIENEEWEIISGVHPGPISLLKIWPSGGDIALLDQRLCTVWPSAAVEQELVNAETGLYRYRPDGQGCYVVRIYTPGNLLSVKQRIASGNFELVGERAFPVTDETLPPEVRKRGLERHNAKYLMLSSLKGRR